jgi:chitinase
MARSRVQGRGILMNRNRRIAARFSACFLAGFLGALPVSSALAQSSPLPKRLVGDYGYWSKFAEPAYSSDQIPFNELTHINHASVSFAPDGSLNVPEGFIEPELITGAHAAGVKVLLLVGGDFSSLSADPSIQSALVSNISSFLIENGYDGVDIDWEYPETAADHDAFVGLLAALRSALPSPMYTISADIPPWGGSAYGMTESVQYVDYFNIMMYDCAGPWTDDGQLNSPIVWDRTDPEPWECVPGGSAQQAVQIFVSGYRVPPSKLNMGTPFYGYWYTRINKLFENCPNSVQGENCNDSVLTENYGTYFKQRVNQKGWTTYYDVVAMVPYMLKSDGSNGFITYDDSFSTYSRVFFADWTSGLGGSFMWSLDADYDGKSQDLLAAMYDATMQLPMPQQ